jgi:hypothetical protein
MSSTPVTCLPASIRRIYGLPLWPYNNYLGSRLWDVAAYYVSWICAFFFDWVRDLAARYHITDLLQRLQFPTMPRFNTLGTQRHVGQLQPIHDSTTRIARFEILKTYINVTSSQTTYHHHDQATTQQPPSLPLPHTTLRPRVVGIAESPTTIPAHTATTTFPSATTSYTTTTRSTHSQQRTWFHLARAPLTTIAIVHDTTITTIDKYPTTKSCWV